MLRVQVQVLLLRLVLFLKVFLVRTTESSVDGWRFNLCFPAPVCRVLLNKTGATQREQHSGTAGFFTSVAALCTRTALLHCGRFQNPVFCAAMDLRFLPVRT